MVYDGLMIDPAIGTLIAGALALLFASAAVHKLQDLATFSASFRAYRVLPWAGLLGRLVPLAEGLIAAALLLPATRSAGALAAVALLLAYALALSVNLARGRTDLSCGCGGVNERRPIAAWMVWRNLALALLGALLLLAPAERPLAAVDFLTVGAGIVVATLLYMSLERLLGEVAARRAAWGER